ncbi:MAG TPA: YbdK family carboxylate-amine ligase [Solirubrobacteraceae bacterium]
MSLLPEAQLSTLDAPWRQDRPVPGWAQWRASAPYSVGIEEEVMVLDPVDFSLALDTEQALHAVPDDLAGHLSVETHEAAIELATSPCSSVEEAGDELVGLRSSLLGALEPAGLRAAAAGTHPFAMWTETRVSGGARYQLIFQTMRELARREPTFALHVHVGVSDPDSAIVLLNRLRAHVPLLLALSANSPFWQGRDTGMASVRTPIFQAFPRVGIPRAFGSYLEYVEAVDQMLRCNAFPEPSFLWWDVRARPQFGTIELRVMDAQSTAERSLALAALVQTIAHLELEEGHHDPLLLHAPEILDENRFLAARDGMDARLLDPVNETQVPAREQLTELLDVAAPHAQELGCENALELVSEIALDAGALRQRRIARRTNLNGLVSALARDFSPA